MAVFLAVAGSVLFILFSGYAVKDLVKDFQGLQSGTQDRPSPFLPRHLRDLFVQPRKFFAGPLALTKWSNVIFVTWCYGVACAISTIDRDLGRESRNRGRPLWNAFGLTVGDAWSDFWVWVIGLGAVVGLFLWLMGGWWYHLRLRWSGAQDPNRLKSHLLYVYSSLVVSGPTMIIAFLWTVMLPNYRYVLVQGRRSFIVLFIFQCWSLVTSYIGASTLFDLQRWKARIWFLALPALYDVLIIGLAVIFAVLSRAHG